MNSPSIGHLIFAAATITIVIGLQYLPRLFDQPADSDRPTEQQARYARWLGISRPEKYSRRALSQKIDRWLRG